MAVQGEAERLRRVVAEAPRGAFVLASVFSAVPVLMFFLVINVSRAASPAPIFYTYLASLPAVVAGVYAAYRLASTAAGTCGVGRLELQYFLVSLLPGLYVAALSYLSGILASCSGKRQPRQAPPMLDVFLAIATAGLHTIIYALGFERSLNALSEASEPGAAE